MTRASSSRSRGNEPEIGRIFASADGALNELKPLGCRVIPFIDPDPAAVAPVHNTGADGIEIYTGSYAAAFRAGHPQALVQACAATAVRAAELGLVVNIGHDLNLDNLPALTAALPGFAEASIGHELTADALVIGFAATGRAYKAALAARHYGTASRGTGDALCQTGTAAGRDDRLCHKTSLADLYTCDFAADCVHYSRRRRGFYQRQSESQPGLEDCDGYLRAAGIVGRAADIYPAHDHRARGDQSPRHLQIRPALPGDEPRQGRKRRCRQSLLGRIFGYGTVIVCRTGGSLEPMRNIGDPLSFRSHITASPSP